MAIQQHQPERRWKCLKKLFRLTISCICTVSFSVHAISIHSQKIRQRTNRPWCQPFARLAAYDDDAFFDMKDLNDRTADLRARMMEQELRKPPDASLSPEEVVSSVLACLWTNWDPYPDSGFRTLLRACDPECREVLYHAVEAPSEASLDHVAEELGEIASKPTSWMRILVGEGEDYVLHFPFKSIDFGDTLCSLECHLLRRDDESSLLVSTNWELQRSSSSSPWMVSDILWRDFRKQDQPIVDLANLTKRLRDE